MNRKTASANVVACLAGLALGPGARDVAAAASRAAIVPSAAHPPAQRRERSSRLPLAFEMNCGQTDARVRFTAHAVGMTAFFTPDETVLALHSARRDAEADGFATDVVRMRFVGASPAPRMEVRDPLPGKCNYFLGSDPSRWVTDAPTCARTVLRDVYPGIDQHWYGGADGRLRYDLVVAPGADPAAVAFVLDGARDPAVEADGTLRASTERGELLQDRPVAFQTADGGRREVEAAFAVSSDGTIRFDVGVHDASCPLTIDPGLTYSSYLGGSGFEASLGVAVDANGAAYVTGYTASTNFPTQSAYQASFGGGSGSVPEDAFVTAINAAGTARIYSTYLGGSGNDRATAIAVDGSGAAYVTGRTGSTNFPTQSAIQGANGGGGDTAFVAKIGASGSSLAYSTYLGGSGGEWGYGIALDGSGAAYVVGRTGSTDFPTQSPLQSASGGNSDVFVAKLNTSGSTLVYSTYLGGGGDEGTLSSIAVDSSGAAYVTGSTNSTDFPTQSAQQGAFGGGGDAFVAKVSASGAALAYSTYLGGSGNDIGYGIAVDSSGGAYVCGITYSSDFPTLAPFQGSLNGTYDAFVAKLATGGSSLVYSTFLGGSGVDAVYSIGVDSGGAATVVGGTQSTNFPTSSPAQSSFAGGSNDAVVTKFNAAGSALVFSTFLGGTGRDIARAVAIDAGGAAYVAGETNSANFPIQSASQATSGGGTQESFVAKYPLVTTGRIPPPPPPPPLPDAPTVLVATYEASSGVTLSWTDNASDETGFRVERHPTNVSYGLLATTTANVTELLDQSSLFPSATYTYRVRAFSANGNSAWSNEASITTSPTAPLPGPPRAPSRLAAFADEFTGDAPVIVLSWIDESSDETGFELDRAVGGLASARAFATAADVAGAVDAPVHPGWPYAYRVRALSLQGASAWSNTAVATVDGTIDLTVTKGTLTDSNKLKHDRIALTATYASASGGAALDPVANGLALQLGSTNAPVAVTIAPGDASWKVKKTKASKKKPSVATSATWKSAKGASPSVTIVVDLVHHVLTAKLTGFDFASAPTTNVRVLVASGADGGAYEATWVERKPGLLRVK